MIIALIIIGVAIICELLHIANAIEDITKELKNRK